MVLVARLARPLARRDIPAASPSKYCTTLTSILQSRQGAAAVVIWLRAPHRAAARRACMAESEPGWLAAVGTRLAPQATAAGFSITGQALTWFGAEYRVF
jgi:hypothetical protein